MTWAQDRLWPCPFHLWLLGYRWWRRFLMSLPLLLLLQVHPLQHWLLHPCQLQGGLLQLPWHHHYVLLRLACRWRSRWLLPHPGAIGRPRQSMVWPLGFYLLRRRSLRDLLLILVLLSIRALRLYYPMVLRSLLPPPPLPRFGWTGPLTSAPRRSAIPYPLTLSPSCTEHITSPLVPILPFPSRLQLISFRVSRRSSTRASRPTLISRCGVPPSIGERMSPSWLVCDLGATAHGAWSSWMALARYIRGRRAWDPSRLQRGCCGLPQPPRSKSTIARSCTLLISTVRSAGTSSARLTSRPASITLNVPARPRLPSPDVDAAWSLLSL